MTSQPVIDREWLNTSFRVEIAGAEIGVSDVHGLGSASELTPGGGPGASSYTPVVLRRALGAGRELFAWRERIVEGQPDLRDVVVELLDGPGGSAVLGWRLEQAWPRRWSGPVLNALDAGVALEEVEIVYARLVWLDYLN